MVGPSSTNDAAPHPEIYEKVEGNGGYQELGDLSRPSLYDGLDQNKLKKKTFQDILLIYGFANLTNY